MTAGTVAAAAVFFAGCGLSALAGGWAMRRGHRPPSRRSSGAARSNCRVLHAAGVYDQDHDVVAVRPLPLCLTDRLDPDRSGS